MKDELKPHQKEPRWEKKQFQQTGDTEE
jgi:hypothetical protein